MGSTAAIPIMAGSTQLPFVSTRVSVTRCYTGAVGLKLDLPAPASPGGLHKAQAAGSTSRICAGQSTTLLIEFSETLLLLLLGTALRLKL
jgi:hypothetical protein